MRRGIGKCCAIDETQGSRCASYAAKRLRARRPGRGMQKKQTKARTLIAVFCCGAVVLERCLARGLLGSSWIRGLFKPVQFSVLPDQYAPAGHVPRLCRSIDRSTARAELSRHAGRWTSGGEYSRTNVWV